MQWQSEMHCWYCDPNTLRFCLLEGVYRPDPFKKKRGVHPISALSQATPLSVMLTCARSDDASHS